MRITAHVRDGRLPDPGDWLGKAGRPALHEALREPETDAAAGRLIGSDEILREIKAR